MFKFTIFLWMGLIAWNLHKSQAQPLNCNRSEEALQDPVIQRKKFGDLLTIRGSILVTPPYGSPEDVSRNGTTPSLDMMEEHLTRMENQLMAAQTRMEMKLLLSAMRRSARPPVGFTRNGFRFFYKGSFTPYKFYDASTECIKIDGYLASFRNQEEFDSIIMDLDPKKHYWVGINDLAVEGHYGSIASNKSASFFKWKQGEPSDINHTKNCVAVVDGLMYDADCNLKKHFICQSDNDI